MNSIEDSRKFNLSVKVIIERVKDNHYAIIKDRKSRIIMKDGVQINSIAQAIRKVYPDAQVDLKTNAPICSKTTTFLNDLSIGISKIK